MTLSQNKKTMLLILIAYTFSIALRLIWVYQFQETDQFKFNNEFMINTNDGYYFAEGAKDILSNDTKDINPFSPIEIACSKLTAFIVKLLPFSFETIIFYLPAFLSSIIVVPIILIGRSLGKLEIGFIASLFASITWSYYNRTMVGYYDTDMLNIVFPTSLLWSLIWAIKTQEEKYLFFTALDIIAYRWWYPQSYSLEFAFFGLIFIYVAYQYIKKLDYKYNLALLTFMMFAMMGLDGYIRFIIILILFLLLKSKKYFSHKYFSHKYFSLKYFSLKYLFIIFGLSIIFFIASGGINPILAQLKKYIFMTQLITTNNNLSLHFFTVMPTIEEATKISFETFANRISGHTITFLVSIIGYIWLAFRHRVILLGLPMIGLGFLAYSGGLRFTMYAVPILALGIAFLIVEVSNKLKTNIAKYSLMSILTLMILYPNINHIINYKISTLFLKNEVQVLDKLKNIASRKDYVVSWWDYGYPIRYYAETMTLSDGGKHNGNVNFPISFVLTHSQKEASNMLRLNVEYTAKRIKNFGQIVIDYGFKDANDFLISLKSDIKLPKKTKDVYLYLPNRLITIYQTIALFSNLDLMTGKKWDKPFLLQSRRFIQNKNYILLGNGMKINKENLQIIYGKKTIETKRYIKITTDKIGNVNRSIQEINPNGLLNIVYVPNSRIFFVVDNNVYNSLYFQLAILGNYDKELFEPIIISPHAKVYKLKI